ncbi:MAG: DUF2330 domain-containing protein [Methylacidiphilales bacterium]|nr:DUF2330 domain-containing protein [Candidatus Methylacidiphilales bacterium]
MRYAIKINYPLALIWLAAAFLLAPLPTQADGCYIASQKAYKKIPGIPAQRALLKWENGNETLIISSTLDSESQKLGWIIPLPSTPTEITKADPGGLKTLSFLVQPEITHLEGFPITATFFSLITVLLVATFLFKRPRFVELLAFLFIVLILAGLAVPAVSTSMGSVNVASSALRVEKTARVGSYEIAVLHSKDIADLNVWLGANDFGPFPEAANPIVINYIKKGWVFAAIKLAREEPGENTPHPLKIAFKSNKAVYPLQLTALAEGAPMFELFVLGNGRASSELLKTEFCDRYNEKKVAPPEEYNSYFSGEKFYEKIGHPDICNLMWNGCVLTKLSGAISASKMSRDLDIAWSDYQPYRRHFYTITGAKTAGYILFILLLGGYVSVSMILNRNPIRIPRGFGNWLAHKVAPGVLLCGLAALILYQTVPKIPADETLTTSRLYQAWFPHQLAEVSSIPFSENPPIFQKSETEIAQAILAEFDRSRKNSAWNKTKDSNLLFGGNVTVESTPGNFTVEKQGSIVIVNIYDAIGCRRTSYQYDPISTSLKKPQRAN